MITFIGDFSMYVLVDLMKEKSEALNKFEVFKDKVETRIMVENTPRMNSTII